MADARTSAAYRSGTNRPSYPGGFSNATVPGQPNTTRALQAMDSILSARFGNSGPVAERAITWGDLSGAGLVNLNFGGQIYKGVGDDTRFASPIPSPSKPETPSQPRNLIGYGAQTTVILTWDKPLYMGHSYTEIFKSANSTFNTASLAGRSYSRVYADRLGEQTGFYYWIRFVNSLGEVGPLTASGTEVVTGTATPGEAQLANDLLVIDKGIIVEALIGDAEIGGAKIQDASIDSAKIVSLSANKITAGAIAIHEFIQSADYVPGTQGWRINGDGSAEFMEISVRATIEAGSSISAPIITGGSITGAVVSAGQLNGTTITGGTVTAANIYGSNFWGSVLIATDGSKWLAFDGLGGYILNTPNAKISVTGATEFSNSVLSGTWTTGLAANSLQWTRTDLLSQGDNWIGA